MVRNATLLGIAVGIVVFVVGTYATLSFVTDGSGGALDPYKVGGVWVFLGAFAGRMMFNVLTPKPAATEPR